ncbi:PREDICTED: dopamine receptor 2-like [Priapulus caudatus]|uniref:Dopamine receptor 2-like n=1 Tax=Priapulus caudatus TaxID=37621 RepID=A0ABM1DUC6_PRICU|nr:PREDICTED: dopamine receptor 2-like [Priapulus caudatus]
MRRRSRSLYEPLLEFTDVQTDNVSAFFSSLRFPGPPTGDDGSDDGDTGDDLSDWSSLRVVSEATFRDSAENISAIDFNVSDFYNLSSSAAANLTTNASDADLQEIDLRHPVLGVLLLFFCVATVFGNMLIVVSVARERYLRSVTNYFIMSLAIADLNQGAIVMPFAAIHEMTRNIWLFGPDWCDLWHSFDVLGSTASILHLCVISLDRYWAITDPFAYPSRMSTGRSFVLIALVWVCSASISFPAIVWWRHAAPPDGYPTDLCLFTEDKGYLLFSSLVSFYIPLLIMLFAYFKIYRAATEQMRSLKCGTKKMSDEGTELTLRIHRGGPRHALKSPQRGDGALPEPGAETRLCPPTPAANGSGMSSRRFNFSISKRLAKIAKEQKAAKTLGIVMGAFVVCWLPFFLTNVLSGICAACIVRPDIVFPVFTWLGYINSAINPVIYALSSRDFRRAFYKTCCTCCPSCVSNYFYLRYRRRMAYQNSISYSYTYSSTSFNASFRL